MSAFEDVVEAWGFKITGDKPVVLSPAGIAPDGSIVYSDAESFRDLIGAEPELGNPSVNGWILSSSSAGVRSWVAPSAHSHAIADVTGLQGALDARMATASYPDLVAIEALAGASGLLRKTAANTWSLDTASYALSSAIPAASSTTPSALGAAAVGTGTTWARADHAHAMPTAAQVGAAAASHSHAIADVTGLQTALDGRSLTSHNHNSLYLGISATAAAATKLATGRILTIGSTGKSFDGSANVSWSLAEIGAQPAGSYAAAVHGHAISDVTGLQSALDGKEPSLGNPSVSGHVLASTTAGVRSWVSLPTIPVTSVFGRTGAVVAASGDYTTAQVAESGNLYYTDARARAAISASAPLSYSGGVVSHLATDGNLHVPATSTTNNGKALVAGSTAGSIAWTSLAISHITGLQSALDAKLSTVTADASSRAANTVYAAPNGSAGTAAFRSLVAADIPSLDTSKLTSGTLGYARGGTGISAPGATAGNLRWSGSAYAIDTASYALSSAIPVASSTTPSALGTAAVGTGTTWARADHAHAMPTAAQVGAATASHNHDAAYLGISATAAAATKLATGRTIGITGDATWTSPTFDGTANVTAALTLASVITAGGPVGGAATVPVITYDAKGRLTAVTTATITPAAIGAQPAGSYASSSHNHTLDSLSNTTITSIATGELLRWNGTVWVNNTLAEAGIQPAGSYLTGNQTITLSGIVTGSGATAITTSIADAALSIAKTSGLQSALNGRMATASYPDLVAIEALAGTSGFLKKTATNTWSLDTNSYLTTSGKAADSELLDGIDSSRFVYGQNNTATVNKSSIFGDIAKSGFYDSTNASDAPTPNTWTHILHGAHTSNPGAWGFQLAANFGTRNSEGYFLRTKIDSNWQPWRTIWTSKDFTSTDIAHWETAYTNNHTHNQSLNTSSSVIFSTIELTSNGAGNNIKVGSDVFLGDVDLSYTLGIKGQADNTQGYIKFGNASYSLGFNGSNLVYGNWRVLTELDLVVTPVSGTGVSGRVAYWSGTGTQTSSANLTFDGTNVSLNNALSSYRVLDGLGRATTLIGDNQVNLRLNDSSSVGWFSRIRADSMWGSIIVDCPDNTANGGVCNFRVTGSTRTNSITIDERITCAFVSINDSSTYILPDADPVGAIRIVNGTPVPGWNPKVATSQYVYLTYSLADGSAYNEQGGIIPVPKRNYMFQKVASDRWCVLGVVS